MARRESFSSGVTVTQAEDLLLRDVVVVESVVQRLVKVPQVKGSGTL